MDYEKKYNEAIERMRKMLGPWRELAYNGKSFLQDLESIFPELRESEDERIRKELIFFLKEEIPQCSIKEHAEKLKEFVSYLENQKEQKPAEWSKEDEKMLTGIIARGSSQVPPYDPALREEQIEWLMNRLKSLRPQPHKEICQAAQHELAIKFMNYRDENRPEGKMCLSNGECEDIDKAFKENDWARIMRYVDKMLKQR